MNVAGWEDGRLDKKKIVELKKGGAEAKQISVYDATLNELVLNVWNWFEERGLNDPVMQMVKVQEEVGELAHEISRARYDTPEVVDALGDILVTVIGMCHHLNIEPGYALTTAYHEIKNRKGKVINGSFVKEEQSNE